MAQRASQETKLLGFSSVMCFHAMYILSAAPAYLHHSSKWSTCKNWHQLTNSADVVVLSQYNTLKSSPKQTRNVYFDEFSETNNLSEAGTIEKY